MTEPTNGAKPPADFTVDREPHAFRLGGVDYTAPAVIGGPTLKKAAAFAAEFASRPSDDAGMAIDKVGEAFAVMIPGPVGRAIQDRITTDEENPLDLRREVLPALYWLMEQYGLRPTQPPSNLPDGSTETTIPSETISSTDGVSPEVSDNLNLLPQIG